MATLQNLMICPWIRCASRLCAGQWAPRGCGCVASVASHPARGTPSVNQHLSAVALPRVQDYSVNFYFRQAWRDPRLEFEPLQAGKVTQIKMGDGRWDEIWVPDTFFRNEKRASFHEITVANRLLKLNATGHVWYVTK